MGTTKTSSNKPDSGSSLSGLKFNSTGREDTTVEVMKVQRDPAAGKRTLAIIAVVVLGLTVLGVLSFQRSGLKIGDALNQNSGHGFGDHQTPTGEVQ
jgi:hypothetical protein